MIVGEQAWPTGGMEVPFLRVIVTNGTGGGNSVLVETTISSRIRRMRRDYQGDQLGDKTYSTTWTTMDSGRMDANTDPPPQDAMETDN